jgi:hypothetical protein
MTSSSDDRAIISDRAERVTYLPAYPFRNPGHPVQHQVEGP